MSNWLVFGFTANLSGISHGRFLVLYKTSTLFPFKCYFKSIQSRFGQILVLQNYEDERVCDVANLIRWCIVAI